VGSNVLILRGKYFIGHAYGGGRYWDDAYERCHFSRKGSATSYIGTMEHITS
jgi:hypothetical protein